MFNLRIASRMFLSIAAFIAILLFIIYYFTLIGNKDNNFANLEQVGNNIETKLISLLVELGKFNIDSYEFINNINEIDQDQQQYNKIIQLINELNQLDNIILKNFHLDQESLKLNNKSELNLGTLSKEWDDLKNSINNDNYNYLYFKFKDKILDLISYINDKSNLVLDPDLDSYYLIDDIIINLPINIDRIINLTISLMNNIYHKKLSKADKQDFLTTKYLIINDLKKLSRDIENSLIKDINFHGVSPNLILNIKPTLLNYQISINNFIDELNKIELNLQKVLYQEFITKSKTVLISATNLFEKVSIELSQLFLVRIEKLSNYKYLVIELTIITILIASFVYCLAIKTITNSLGNIKIAINYVTEDNFKT